MAAMKMFGQPCLLAGSPAKSTASTRPPGFKTFLARAIISGDASIPRTWPSGPTRFLAVMASVRVRDLRSLL